MSRHLRPIRRLRFVLTSAGELTIRTHDNKKVSANSWDIIQELWPRLVKAGAHITIMMPADYLRRVSWLVDVPEDMRMGERLTVPFRKPLRHENSFSSEERTTSLVCTRRTGNILTLESNREKHRDEMMLMWHVQVDYNLQEHLPTRITDNRFRQLVDPSNGNIHTTREGITLRPL